MGYADDKKLQEQDKRREKTAAKRGTRSRGQGQFVNVNLSKAEKETLKAMELDPFEFTAFIDSYSKQGYRISFAPDKIDGVTGVYMTGVDEKCQNKGYTVSARARTATKALLVLMFKVAEILPDDWSLHSTDGEDFMM